MKNSLVLAKGPIFLGPARMVHPAGAIERKPEQQVVTRGAHRRAIHPLGARHRRSQPPSVLLARRVVGHPEAGMATAEYAIATIAAVGFAGLLIVVLKSDTVRGLLTSLITSALSIG